MSARGSRWVLFAGACLAASPVAAQSATGDDIVDTLKEALAMAYRTNPTLLAAQSIIKSLQIN